MFFGVFFPHYYAPWQIYPGVYKIVHSLTKFGELYMEKIFNQLKVLRKERDQLIAKHQWKRALENVNKMIRIYPSASSYTRQGMLFVKLNKYREAIASFKQALKIDSNYGRAREILVKLSSKMDETCLETFDHLLESNINKKFATSDVSVTMLDLNPSVESAIIPITDIYDTDIIEITPVSQTCIPKVTEDKKEKRTLGPYKIIEVIGLGGMGKVFRAYHPELEREVAIKVMHSDVESQKQLKRFFVEAKLMAKLNHPSIVSVYDVGAIDEQNYIVMDYIKGESLRYFIMEKFFSPKKSIEIIRQVALAMHYAHENGVIHRDLKPANIMIDKDTKLPVVMDFGLAKDLHPSGEVTRSGEILGTPRYMSPEQAEGKQNLVGAHTDVYSLGTVLYELLTHEPAVPGNDPAGIIYNILYLEVIPPRKKNSNLSHGIEAICLKCLEKNIKNRYRTAKALADDIERLLNGEMIKARPGIRKRIFRKIKRHKRIFTIAAIFLFSLAILSMTMYSFRLVRDDNYVQNLLQKAQQTLTNATTAKMLKEKFPNVNEYATTRKQLEQEVEQSLTKHMHSRLYLEQALIILPNNEKIKNDLYHIEKEIGFLALLGKKYFLSELSFAHCKKLTEKEEAKEFFSLVSKTKSDLRKQHVRRLHKIMRGLENSPPEAGMLDEYVIETVRMGESYIVRTLVPYLKYGNKWQKSIAIESLGKIGNRYTKYKGSDVVQWLIGILEEIKIDGELEEAEKIVWALGRLRDQRANQVVDEFRMKSGQHSVFWNKTIIPYKWIPLGNAVLQTAKAYCDRGKGWFFKGDRKKAIADFKKAIEKKSDLFFAYNALGICYYDLKQFDLAIENYSKAISISPREPKGYSNRGECYQEMKLFAKAIADYTQAINVDKNFHYAYANRAKCYRVQKNIKLAIINYTIAIEISPPNEVYYTDRGNCYRQNDEMDKALADHATAIQINGKYSEAYSNRGLCYQTLRLYKKAIRDYSIAIELNPQTEETYLQRANCYKENGDIKNAINDCSIAIQINNKKPGSYLQRGTFYQEAQNLEKAMDDFNTAIVLKPSFKSYFKRAILYKRQKKHEMAIDDLRKCLTFENKTKKQEKNLKLYFKKFDQNND